MNFTGNLRETSEVLTSAVEITTQRLDIELQTTAEGLGKDCKKIVPFVDLCKKIIA
jgi:hypothetical protein